MAAQELQSDKNAGLSVLTSVAEIRRLPKNEASKRIPVQVRAVVLYMNAASFGDLFVAQDGVGIYVEIGDLRRTFSPGTLLQITGTTDKGQYAPVIAAEQITVLGEAAIPPPIWTSVPELASGARDGQWVQISGIVRAARIDRSPELKPNRLILDIAAPGGRVSAWVLAYSGDDLDRLTDSVITVRGACLHYSNWRGQSFNFRLVCNSVSQDISIEKPPEPLPFSMPVTSVGELLQFRPEGAPIHRVRIRGSVTYAESGEVMGVMDDSGSALVYLAQQTPVEVGDIVDVAGFVTIRELSPILEDAVFRIEGKGNARDPVAATAAQILHGHHDGELIRIVAEVEDIATDDDDVTFFLRDGEHLFPAVLPIRGLSAKSVVVPSGSKVAVTGVCTVRLGTRGRFVRGGKPESFSLLLRAGNDIEVLRAPSWLTARRLTWVLGGTTMVFIVALAWAFALRKKNVVLHEQIDARQKAENSLRQMHAELEERVQHRTQQLVNEISARHEAEAVLDERNRLASELHDTLQQGLTGLALQLEAASRAIEVSSAASKRHLELARNIVRQSEAEVRRSVWNLRSQLLDENHLAESIQITVAQAIAGAGLKFEFRCTGSSRRFPDVIENNLLRLVQEAATNVLRHANASRLMVYLDQQDDRIQLIIEDDGVGFNMASVGAPKDGHFGLLGMKERVKRLSGNLRIDGRIGEGCRIEVAIPVTNVFSITAS